MKGQWVVVCALVGLVCAAVNTAAGSDGGSTNVGNGGDSYVIEFIATGRGIARALKAGHLSFLPVDAAKFAACIETAEVASVEKTLLNGVEVDAINYPGENRIEVSRSRWQVNRRAVNHRFAVVLHEYLGLMGVKDKKAELSSQYLDFLEGKTGEEIRLSREILEGVLLDTLQKESHDRWGDKGEFGFEFDEIPCDSRQRRCTVVFEILDRKDEKRVDHVNVVSGETFDGKLEAVRLSRLRYYEVLCFIKDVETVEDLVFIDKGGAVKLGESFESSMTDCINALKKQIKKRFGPIH